MQFSRRSRIALAAAAFLAASAALFSGEPPLIDRLWDAVIPGASADDAMYEDLNLRAIVGTKELYVMRGTNDTLKIYDVAVGTAQYPTPTGNYRIRRIVWNPSWTPPNSPWARGKKPRGPKDPGNPMKVAKIFFKEPDYYIHGTGDTNSLGWEASHGCLRMHPDDVARVAQYVMNAGGVAHDWDWVKRTLHIGETRTVNLRRPVPIYVTRELPEFMVAKPKADSAQFVGPAGR